MYARVTMLAYNHCTCHCDKFCRVVLAAKFWLKYLNWHDI